MDPLTNLSRGECGYIHMPLINHPRSLSSKKSYNFSVHNKNTVAHKDLCSGKATDRRVDRCKRNPQGSEFNLISISRDRKAEFNNILSGVEQNLRFSRVNVRYDRHN